MHLTASLIVFVSSVCWASAAVVSPFDYPGLFEEYSSYPISNQRDPRQERGPVLFPQTPVGDETSGVRVGASGYGFVPPGRSGRVGSASGGPHYFDDVIFWR